MKGVATMSDSTVITSTIGQLLAEPKQSSTRSTYSADRLVAVGVPSAEATVLVERYTAATPGVASGMSKRLQKAEAAKADDKAAKATKPPATPKASK